MIVILNPRLWRISEVHLPDGLVAVHGEPLDLDDESWEELRNHRTLQSSQWVRTLLPHEEEETPDPFAEAAAADLDELLRPALLEHARAVGAARSGTNDDIRASIRAAIAAAGE